MNRLYCPVSLFSSSHLLIFFPPQITYVDFLMYDVLDQNRMFEPKCLDQFQNLKDFLVRFEVWFVLTPIARSSLHIQGQPSLLQGMGL